MFRGNHSPLHVLPEKLGLLLITQDFRGALSTACLAATSTRRTHIQDCGTAILLGATD